MILIAFMQLIIIFLNSNEVRFIILPNYDFYKGKFFYGFNQLFLSYGFVCFYFPIIN
jgi:hypothetical protein